MNAIDSKRVILKEFNWYYVSNVIVMSRPGKSPKTNLIGYACKNSWACVPLYPELTSFPRALQLSMSVQALGASPIPG